jgi:hypothetical protein
MTVRFGVHESPQESALIIDRFVDNESSHRIKSRESYFSRAARVGESIRRTALPKVSCTHAS